VRVLPRIAHVFGHANHHSTDRPATTSRHKDSRSPILNLKLLEFIKIVEIAAVQVFGFVENEHIFNTANFMKKKL